MVLSATSIRISPGLTNEHKELEDSPARPTELDIFSAAKEDIASNATTDFTNMGIEHS